ncbi:NIPSNAP family protein [Xanthomonas campestris pv. campestris]|nr:NIPSNAP family protein [Xanthomonas campestris pv. campestris]
MHAGAPCCRALLENQLFAALCDRPYLLAEFEQYARLWIPLVTRCGGQHHGDLLPSEGRTTASLAAYERYRSASLEDAECLAAFAYAEHTRCIISDERSFFRPLPGGERCGAPHHHPP